MKIKHYLAETRLPFTSASVVPILVGTAYAYYHSGVFHFPIFILALVAIVFLHLGANVLNDYYDWKFGTDNVNTSFVRPFTGGSRMIQNGILTPREVLGEGLAFLALGSALGVILVLKTDFFILILGMTGVFLGFFHSAPPFKLHSRSLGELGIGLAFGVLPVLGAFYIQTLKFSWDPVLVSIPVALLIGAVLFVNGFQDREADRSTGKITLTVSLGKIAPHFLVVLITLPYLVVLALVLGKLFAPPALIVLGLVPLTVVGVEFVLRYSDDPIRMVPANASVVALHVIFGVVYSVSILLRGGLVSWLTGAAAAVMAILLFFKLRKAPAD